MNSIMKTMVLVGGVVSLSACAACPKQTDYDRTPYGNRTEGTGVAVYGGHCAAAQEEVVTRTEQVETREPVRPAEPVFNDRVRK